MSKKPYIVQENSPNLVIVPSDTLHEPSPKKVKESDAPVPQPTPNPICTSVFSRKTAKLNHNHINKDVLIDVHKVQRSPKSWAANFLQSIGGPSTKFDRIYSLVSKSTTHQESTKETTLPKTNNQHQTNTDSTLQIMEKRTSQPKINMNFIKSNKDASKSNSNTDNTTTKSTNVRKEPSLPKNYKIPMQSKNNKPPIQLTDKFAEPNTTSFNSQDCIKLKNQTLISTSKTKDDIVQPDYNKMRVVSNVSINQTDDAHSNKEPKQLYNDLTNCHSSKSQDKVQVKRKTNTERHKFGNEIKRLETQKMSVQHIEKYCTTKCNELVIPSKYKETVQLVNNKENNHPKHNKESKQRHTIKDLALPRHHKEPGPTGHKNINRNFKTDENIISHIKAIKEMYKLKNKQEPSFSTKLKTKKEAVSVISSNSSKTEKHSKPKDKTSQKIPSKKYKETLVVNKETHLKKKDIIAKLKKKRATEKKSGQDEYSGCKSTKTKKHKLSADTSAAKNKMSVNKERLSKSISPIKSVVSLIKTDHFHNSDKNYRKESGYYHSPYEKTSSQEIDYHCQNQENYLQGSDVDLRTKLKRKNHKNDYRKDDHKRSRKEEIRRNYEKDKFASVRNGERFVPEENLIISFNAEDDAEEKPTMKEKSPINKLVRKQTSPKDKKHKKLKLEISFVFGHDDSTDEESTKSEMLPNVETIENMDISFLDDFNVDEIAKSLNECNDCTRKPSDRVDVDVRDTILDDNNKIKTKTNKDVCVEKNIIKNHQEPIIESRVNTLRHCNEEIQNKIYSHLGTETNNTSINKSVKHEIKNDNSCDIKARTSFIEAPLKKTSSDNFTDLDHIETGQTLAKINMLKANTDINNDNNMYNTSLLNNAEAVEMTHTEHSLQLVTNAVNTKIIRNTENDKQHLASLETPVVMLRSDSNIYSDHNDLIDALQDNSDLGINAIQSYIASLNNNNSNESTKNEKASEIKNSNAPEITNVKQTYTVINSTHNIIKMLRCIKEDPDIILIDDSDSEHEIELKNKQLVEEKEAVDIPPNIENLSGKPDELTIIEDARENSESILVMDTKTKYLQPVKNSKFDQFDENVFIEPNGETSEPEESDKTSKLNESNQNEQSKNKILEEQGRPDKTAQEDSFTAIEISTSSEIPKETKESLINKPESTKVPPVITKPDSRHAKDKKENLPDTANVASNINSKASEESPSKTTVREDIPEECSPKSAAGNTKTHNADAKEDTSSHNKGNPETHNGNQEKVTKNNEVQRSSNLANSKFVQAMEAKLFSSMGEKYTVTDVIRYDGRFSKIYRCKDSLKRDYAIKTLKKTFDGYNQGLQKQDMMIKLQNGVPENNLNCVRYIFGFLASGLWCFLMEYFPMNLQQALSENQRSFHIDDVQILGRQLVSAVTILRNNNIIHSDIKPSHILINSSQTRIKLCGFDQACYLQHSNLLPNTGTVNYRAPELILGYPAGYGIDVWSTALVMYEMATNRKLFTGIYNNSILYQQLCTLGAIPMEMLVESKYRNAHFKGMAFMKCVGKNQKIVIKEIEFNAKLNTTLFQVYTTNWGKERLAQKRDDKAKIRAFSKLLHSMLAMHPRCRIAIEFVFADPFIYEYFDDC